MEAGRSSTLLKELKLDMFYGKWLSVIFMTCTPRQGDRNHSMGNCEPKAYDFNFLFLQWLEENLLWSPDSKCLHFTVKEDFKEGVFS